MALHDYGLTENILATVFNQVLKKDDKVEWHLKVVPATDFYQKLHLFLKKWPLTCNSSKMDIGRFYIAIDPDLKRNGIRADNAYRRIEKISKQPPEKVAECKEIRTLQAETKQYVEKMQSLTSDYFQLKKTFNASKKQLVSSRKALQTITNQNMALQKQYVWCCKEKGCQVR